MAWSWSHTAEGMRSVQERIELKDREWLEIVYAEWQAAEVEEGSCREAEFNQEKYDAALLHAKTVDTDCLAEEIYRRSEEYSTCTNGGHEAYCCPFGCVTHLVSFSEVSKCENCGEPTPKKSLVRGECKKCR